MAGFTLPWLRSQRAPRVLCYVNHFYGQSKGFIGKSSKQSPTIRKSYVETVVSKLKTIPSATVHVCGIPGQHLVPLDIEFTDLENPCHLVYATIEHMTTRVGEWDYFINIEDDIAIDPSVFQQIVEFDRENLVNECLLPNRMENKGGRAYCVDLLATPGWTFQFKKFKNSLLRVAVSPHSGLLVLSQEKLRYAASRVDVTRREVVIGGLMASAYANIHSVFSMYRPFQPEDSVTVQHLDVWEPEQA